MNSIMAAVRRVRLQNVVSVLSELLNVEVKLLLGVVFMFLMNTIGSLWFAYRETGRRLITVGNEAMVRAGVYLLLVPAAIVLSRMWKPLDMLRAPIIAGVAAWEFLVLGAILARISPGLAPLYWKLHQFVKQNTSLTPGKDNIEETVDGKGQSKGEENE